MNIKIIILLFASMFTLWSCGAEISENSQEKEISQESENLNISRVSLDVFKQELTKNDAIIIDLRTTPELQDTGIIPGAIQIDYYASDFSDTINALDKDEKYLIYCRSGNRSGQTLGLMEQLGFKNVQELEGGIGGWQRAGESLVPFVQ